MSNPTGAPGHLTGMGAIDVERVRFSEERDRCAVFTRACDRLRVGRVVPNEREGSAVRRSMRSRGLLLTETIAPGPLQALRDAKAALGLTGPVDLYLTSWGAMHANARMGMSNPPHIEVIGHYLATLDPIALTALFGHELGHLMAHGPDSQTGHVQRRCRQAKINVEPLSLAAELTADRFGLLACRDLAGALRLEMMSVAGLTGAAVTWDTEGYLDECKALVIELLERRERTFGSTHPEHGVRAYAVWLFSESDVYREITGQGSGRLLLEDIDVELNKLLPPYHEPGLFIPTPAEVVAAASPLPAPAPRPPVPSGVPSLRAQLDFAMKDLRVKLTAMLAPRARKP